MCQPQSSHPVSVPCLRSVCPLGSFFTHQSLLVLALSPSCLPFRPLADFSFGILVTTSCKRQQRKDHMLRLFCMNRINRKNQCWVSVERRETPTSVILLLLELFLLPLAHSIQVNLVADPYGHHDPDHCAQSRAEDPHGVRGSTPHWDGGSI